MFAPPFATVRAKTLTSASHISAPLQPVIRRTKRQDSNLPAPTVREGASKNSWKIGAIPIFPPNRASQTGPSARWGAPPMFGVLQAKLAIGRVDDPMEHEADRVADQVMRMPAPDVAPTSAPPQI